MPNLSGISIFFKKTFCTLPGVAKLCPLGLHLVSIGPDRLSCLVQRKKYLCLVLASSVPFGLRSLHLFLARLLSSGYHLLFTLSSFFPRLLCTPSPGISVLSVVGRLGSNHLHTLTSEIPILARQPRCLVSFSLPHRIVLTAASYRSPLLVTLHHRRVLGGLTPRVGSIGGKGICRTSHPDSFPACVSSVSF